MMQKPIARIDDWLIVEIPGSRHLIGRLRDHPRQSEFQMPFQATSALVRVDLDQNQVETENTIYTLLGPMPPELIPIVRAAVGLPPESTDAG